MGFIIQNERTFPAQSQQDLQHHGLSFQTPRTFRETLFHPHISPPPPADSPPNTAYMYQHCRTLKPPREPRIPVDELQKSPAPRERYSPPPRASQIFAARCSAPVGVPVSSTDFYTLDRRVLSSRFAVRDLDDLDFAVCASCFASRIAPFGAVASCFAPLVPSSLVAADSNIKEKPPVYQETFCRLNLPRVQKLLHKAVLLRSIQPLVDFARFARTLSGCDRQNVSQAAIHWASRRIHGLTVCNSCYEHFLRSTNFERQFCLEELALSAGERSECHVGLDGFVSRLLLQELESGFPDFLRFAARVRPRVSLPSCPGPNVAIAQAAGPPVIAYKATHQDGDSGLYCEACFYDHMKGTVFEGLATRRELREGSEQTGVCDLAMNASGIYSAIKDPPEW